MQFGLQLLLLFQPYHVPRRLDGQGAAVAPVALAVPTQGRGRAVDLDDVARLVALFRGGPGRQGHQLVQVALPVAHGVLDAGRLEDGGILAHLHAGPGRRHRLAYPVVHAATVGKAHGERGDVERGRDEQGQRADGQRGRVGLCDQRRDEEHQVNGDHDQRAANQARHGPSPRLVGVGELDAA